MRKNAKLNRNALRGLVAALALGGLQVAHAGYAQLQAPQGFGGTTGAHTYAAAANDKVFGRVIHSPGSLTANVGGQAVKMPASYRLAANAPRIAAAVVMQHPAIRIGAAAVGVASWLLAAKLVWDEASQTWRAVEDPTKKVGDLFRVNILGFPDKSWYTSPEGACNAYLSFVSARDSGSYSYRFVNADNGRCLIQARRDGTSNWIDSTAGIERKIVESPLVCPDGWTTTPAGCLSPALQQPEFVDRLAKHPMPETVPLELPRPSPLPIEQPSPWINPSPGPNPSHQPYRVPTGEPSPIPNTDPQQWRQPYIDIIPAPTPDNPWRVDLKPGETTSTNPKPVENPQPDGEDKPTPEEDKSLCEKYPDILACSKPELDIPDGEIPKVTKQITYAEEGGFGGGSCPSNVYANLHGKQTMVYEWTRTCSVVSTYIRPIILLLGAMGALFILIPGRDS